MLTISCQSIETQRSVIGYIANAVAFVGKGDHESAIRVFDLVFTDGLATDNNYLLLIKVCANRPRYRPH